MEESDLDVVERVRKGDRDAFRILVERHSRSLFQSAYRLTGNTAEAEDTVQEAFLRAFHRLDQYNRSASFATWLQRIAVNHAYDLLRRRKRHGPHQPIDQEELPMTAAVSKQPSPLRSAVSVQVRDKVERAMATLSPQERAAFVLRHFEHCPVEQISRDLGISGAAAKQAIFRAVQKLRRELEPFAQGGFAG